MDFYSSESPVDKQFAFKLFGIAGIHWFKSLIRPIASTIAFGIALGLSATPAAQAYTEVVSFTYDDRSYKAYNNTSPITWTEARTFAQLIGGDLVSLNTPAENAAVFDQIGYLDFPNLWNSVTGSQFVGPYIGLYQPTATEVTTGWQWVDGSLLTSSSWYQSQPDNGFGVENIALYFNKVSDWADIYDCATTSVPCTVNDQPANAYLSKSLIVEFPPVPTPPPILGGMAALGWSRRLRRRIRQVNL